LALCWKSRSYGVKGEAMMNEGEAWRWSGQVVVEEKKDTILVVIVNIILKRKAGTVTQVSETQVQCVPRLFVMLSWNCFSRDKAFSFLKSIFCSFS
jgi:hypothetical protein